ncbi:MAG: helix-hairpin-helix domain-containing protein [Proteobacteria bacterium]|nr:helix-hairpin-helix domain-containing protein [Pseudomonadota bacterium]
MNVIRTLFPIHLLSAASLLCACTTDTWVTQADITLASAETHALSAHPSHTRVLPHSGASTPAPIKPARITPRKTTGNTKPRHTKSDNHIDTPPRVFPHTTPQSDHGFDFTSEPLEIADGRRPGAQIMGNTADHGFDFTSEPLENADGRRLDELITGNTADHGFDFTSEPLENADGRRLDELITGNEDALGFDFTSVDIEKASRPQSPIAHNAQPSAHEPSDADCIDINTADIAELMRLPGIGKNRAQAIVASRAHKSFKRKKDIKRIKGIGNKSYLKLSGMLCEI